MNRGVSVIICCFNSAQRLPETLNHLVAQTTALSWEIILVDNASTDATAGVADQYWKKYGRKDVPLRIVEQPKPGLSFAREKGIETARYEFLIFCDDDNWLAANYVTHAFLVMTSDAMIGIAGGNGTAVSDSALPPWFEEYKGCYACYPQGDREGVMSQKNAFLYGAGMVVRKSCLDKLNGLGFKPLLPDRIGTQLSSGGDTELSYAVHLIGYKLWYSPQLKFRHYLPPHRLTEDYLLRLVSAMSYCSGLLISYDYVLEGRKVDGFSWIKDALYQMLFFFRAIVRNGLRKKTRDRQIALTFAWNRMKSIVGQIGRYRHNYHQAAKIKITR